MNNNDYLNFMTAGGLGAAKGIGGFLGNMFSYDNPADEAMEYYNKIPATLEQYLGPYINAGQKALPTLESQYGQLTSDPGARMNQIGAGYQQSPGYQFSMDQAMQGASNAAAAGGMAGSPMHEQQSMQLATNLANQDYNNYLQNAMKMYSLGLGGEQSLYNTGAKAGISMGEDLSSLLAQQGMLKYMGQAGQNQAKSSMFGDIIGGASAAIPFLF